jgi:hypothetical protein
VMADEETEIVSRNHSVRWPARWVRKDEPKAARAGLSAASEPSRQARSGCRRSISA